MCCYSRAGELWSWKRGASERALANASSATDLDALADLYRSQGKHEEAKRLEERAREIRSKSGR